MEKKFALTKKIVSAIEHYEKLGNEPDHLELLNFAEWLAQEERLKLTTRAQDDPRVHIENSEDIASRVCYHVERINKYAKYYMKLAMKDTELVSGDDFAYLAALAFSPSMKKTELISLNVGEIPTGMEVIKRLLKHGLVADYQDLEDKRARRIKLTEKGRALFYEMLPKMNIISGIVKGNLTNREIKQLYELLQKLDLHHEKLYPVRQTLSSAFETLDSN
ncbi:MAG: winged helix DNA-binding protein [Schleiferiaceae bacterium]|nr:winged helix DNA-binding protein [Schleiferiaceae bacterium]